MTEVLLFTNSYPPRRSGLAIYNDRLADMLEDLGFSVTVVALDTECVGSFRDESGGRLALRLPCWSVAGYFVPTMGGYRSMRRELSSRPADLVITNTRFFLVSYFGKRFAQRRGVPHIHIEHGSTYVQSGNPAVSIGSRLFDHTLGRSIINHADNVVCVSAAAADFSRRLSGRDAMVIPNGILSTREPKPRKRPLDTLIYVGRLSYGKGVQDLLEAMSILNDNDLRLVVVGSGPFEGDLNRLARDLGIESQVIFKGQLSSERVHEELLAADIFVNPSYSEGLPTTVLEAGSVGLPVIATNVGGTAQVIDGSTGILVEPRDPHGLARSISSMREGPGQARERGLRLMERIEGEYTWKAIRKRWKDLLVKTLNER